MQVCNALNKSLHLLAWVKYFSEPGARDLLDVNNMWKRHMATFKKENRIGTIMIGPCLAAQVLPSYRCQCNSSLMPHTYEIGFKGRAKKCLYCTQHKWMVNLNNCIIFTAITVQDYEWDDDGGPHRKPLIKNHYNSRWPRLFIKFINAFTGLSRRNVL